MKEIKRCGLGPHPEKTGIVSLSSYDPTKPKFEANYIPLFCSKDECPLSNQGINLDYQILGDSREGIIESIRYQFQRPDGILSKKLVSIKMRQCPILREILN